MLFNWLAELKQIGRIIGTKKRRNRRQRLQPTKTPTQAELLEDRVLLTVTAVVDSNNVLTVELDAANDQAFITSNPGNQFRVGTTAGANDILADTAGIVSIVVNDTGSAAGQLVDFLGSDFTLTAFAGIGVDVNAIETINFDAGVSSMGSVTADGTTIGVNDVITATGTAMIELNAAQNIALSSAGSLTTIDGALTLSANATGTATGDTVGIALNGATIRSTGSGTISLTGQGSGQAQTTGR
ncbi:MAG: hypothetical protein KDA84_16240, partial [Planctomycetaceae bacterium]|nr:hypothetical protein [Planctomycetaceae bacterium]